MSTAVDSTRIEQALGSEAWRWARRLGALAVELDLDLYLVGGPVRDLLLGRAVVDVDLMVDGGGRAVAPGLARKAQDRWGGEVVVHRAFHTASWRPEPGVEVDLATARTEVYPRPGALPQVTPSDLAHDLARRDFTVNAMAVALRPDRLGELHDPHGGQADLEAGVLRVLHAGSFADDPTRGLRAARYCARYGLELAPDTASALEHAVRREALAAVGLERMGHELDRVFTEERALPVVERVFDWGLLSRVWPQWYVTSGLRRTLRQVDGGGVPPELCRSVRWLLLAGSLPDEERGRCQRVVTEGGAGLARWLRGLGPAQLVADGLETVGRASEAGRLLAPLDEVEVAAVGVLGLSPAAARWHTWWVEEGRGLRTVVDGRRLLALGAEPGPAVGRALEAAQAAAWEGKDADTQLYLALTALGMEDRS